MRHIAHRGCIDKENTIHGVLEAFETFDTVEIDVRYNSERKVIMCHDRENRNYRENQYLEDLLQRLPKNNLTLVLDIKAFGIETAQRLAREIVAIIVKYPQHTYELCSFNEYCVQELLDARQLSKTYIVPYSYRVGVIASGIPVGLFGHLAYLDFISLNYDIIHDEVMEKCRQKRREGIQIYGWTCNDKRVQDDMENRYVVDAIIYDVFSKDYKDNLL